MNLRLVAHIGVALASLFCAFFAFSSSLDTGFSGADFAVLEPALRVRSAADAITPPWIPPFERPLSQLAFAGEVSLWGLRAPRYVVTHMVLHAANATLLFALFRGPLGSAVAAGAAILFALALGFYGESVWRPAHLSILLATTFVLGTGIVALRAQLERTPRRRLLATLLTAELFLLALFCHEAGAMALVMLGGLMWPHRRSLSSVLRKMAFLVILGSGAVILQLLRGQGADELLLSASTWLSLPVRVLRLLSQMLLPLAVQPVESASEALLPRVLTLVEQTRPISGLLFLGAGALWFVKGGGAVRWLLSSYLAFLVPLSLHPLTQARLDLGETCLPAAFLCGAVALGFHRLWHRVGTAGRVLLALVLVGILYGDLAVVRRYQAQAAAAGRSAESELRLQALRQQREAAPHP